jgi:hypothetical protein
MNRRLNLIKKERILGSYSGGLKQCLRFAHIELACLVVYLAIDRQTGRNMSAFKLVLHPSTSSG